MTVNVLGEEYTLDFIPEEDDDGLRDCDGYCDDTTKRLVVKQYKRGEPGEKKNLELQAPLAYVFFTPYRLLPMYRN